MTSIVTHSRFIVRLPVQPISELYSLLSSPPEEFSSTKSLLTLLSRPAIEAALFVASPGLLAEWYAYLTHPAATLNPDLEATLWKYVFRLYSRATPFGLFSAVGVGRLAAQTQIKFGDQPWRSLVRPDMSWMITLTRTLLEIPAIRTQLRYRLNNSLYTLGDQYRYSERANQSEKNAIDLVAVEKQPLLDNVITFLQANPHPTYAQLVEQTEGDESFIDLLIAEQLLYSDLELPVTGPASLAYVVTVLQPIPEAATYRKQLSQLFDDLNINRLTASRLSSACRQLTNLTGTDWRENGPPIQVNSYFFPHQFDLDKSIANTIGQQLQHLQVLRSPADGRELDAFKKRFYDRYQDQQVPLLEVLDSDIGIGFGSGTADLNSLLNGLTISDTPPSLIQADRLDGLRQKLYSAFLLSKKEEVLLTDADLMTAKKTEPALSIPASWYSFGELYRTSTPDLKGEPWQYLLKIAEGPSATFLIGRFCQEHEAISQLASQITTWEAEQYPDDILAEIAHLPEGKAANVITRPVLRPFEIPYLTPASVDAEYTLPLTDLLVSVVQGHTVELFSRRHQKRVRPRLSSAHKSDSSDQVYRFLHAVLKQETSSTYFSWGYLSNQPRLPRVVYKNLILKRAQWFIQRADLNGQPLSLPQLQAIYQLPRFVLMVEKDNELLLDLSLEVGGRILLEEVKRKERVLLLECLTTPQTGFITNGSQTFASELILAHGTTRTEPGVNTALYGATKPVPQSRRAILPGGTWFYCKLYSSHQQADRILIELLAPFWKRGQKAGLCDLGYFIRYEDPEPHLRFRLRCQPETYGKLVTDLHKMLEPWVGHRLIYRVNLDTYFPELERYEPTLMASCEAIFAADSTFFLDYLASQPGEPSEVERIVLAITSVDDYLNQLGFTMADKIRFTRHRQQAFWKEFGAIKETKQHLNNQFRQWPASQSFPSRDLSELLNQRQTNLSGPLIQLLTYFEEPIGSSPRALKVIESILHMALNRIFPDQNRKYEMMVYHFLARHYESNEARRNKEGQLPAKP